MPLAATLKQTGLRLDVDAANAHVGRWITGVANARIHATTRERPDRRLAIERTALAPLPRAGVAASPPAPACRPIPAESLQHPLSIYNELLEVRA